MFEDSCEGFVHFSGDFRGVVTMRAYLARCLARYSLTPRNMKTMPHCSARILQPADSRFKLHILQRVRCEFLEARITPKRIEHRIEPEKGRSKRRVFGQHANVRYREQLL